MRKLAVIYLATVVLLCMQVPVTLDAQTRGPNVANAVAPNPNDPLYQTKGGVDAVWMPVAGGDHLEAWTMVFPQMLDFFDRHKKK